MQRIFDQVNAAAKIYRDMDLASKLNGPSLKELGSLGRVEYDSLAKQFQSVVGDTKAYFESPAYEMTKTLERQLHQDELYSRAARMDLVSNLLGKPDYDDWFQTITKATKEVLSQYDLARSLGMGKFPEEVTKNASWIRNVQAAASPVLSMLASEFINSAKTGRFHPAW
jgi:hypothetical protein